MTGVETLVDSSVLLDIFTDDKAWADWSADALREALDLGRVHVNPVVYAEVSVRFPTPAALDDALGDQLVRSPLPYDAAFVAGRAHAAYRRRGGPKTTTLPDFFIGAHAAVAGLRLLTRDPGRIKTYYPGVAVTAPDSGV